MKLEKELKLKQHDMGLNHEALLSIVRTSSMMHKLGERFFIPYGITDTQFNILMTLKEFKEGLNQQELSEKLIVHKSNVTGLVDRLEKLGYVKRHAKPNDRRSNQIKLTADGQKLLTKTEQPYFDAVHDLMNILSKEEKKAIVCSTEKLRRKAMATL
jgi:DNA-binding MarR family transcriptional regulator